MIVNNKHAGHIIDQPRPMITANPTLQFVKAQVADVGDTVMYEIYITNQELDRMIAARDEAHREFKHRGY